MVDINKEKELETRYIKYLAPHCIDFKEVFDTQKTINSISGYLKAIGIGAYFSDYEELYDKAMSFLKVKMETKQAVFDDLQIETYLIWKIWQNKLQDVTNLVYSPECRLICHLLNSKGSKEAYKLTSTFKTIAKELNVADLADPDVKKLLIGLIEKAETHLLSAIEEYTTSPIRALIEGDMIPRLMSGS